MVVEEIGSFTDIIVIVCGKTLVYTQGNRIGTCGVYTHWGLPRKFRIDTFIFQFIIIIAWFTPALYGLFLRFVINSLSMMDITII